MLWLDLSFGDCLKLGHKDKCHKCCVRGWPTLTFHAVLPPEVSLGAVKICAVGRSLFNFGLTELTVGHLLFLLISYDFIGIADYFWLSLVFFSWT
jgi:hypothetical protein